MDVGTRQQMLPFHRECCRNGATSEHWPSFSQSGDVMEGNQTGKQEQTVWWKGASHHGKPEVREGNLRMAPQVARDPSARTGAMEMVMYWPDGQDLVGGEIRISPRRPTMF